MKEIIAPIDRELLLAELTKDKLLRRTNAGDNDIYLVDAHDSPNMMLEIGRLREITFRQAGGGTGKEVDIDEYDTAAVPFKQLIVWDPEKQELISAYRFILGRDVPLDENGYPHTPTSKLFHFSPEFIENQWQRTIELGRSFVQPKYQATVSLRLGLFSLDNVWDGLGTLIVDNEDIDYFFGKMTMYSSYNRLARNLIHNFLERHYKGDENLVKPQFPVKMKKEKKGIKALWSNSITEDFKLLNKNIRDLKETIPPLIKTYITLSPTMQYFGASYNHEFGEVEEIAILINIHDIYEEKKKRHIDTYRKSDEVSL